MKFMTMVMIGAWGLISACSVIYDTDDFTFASDTDGGGDTQSDSADDTAAKEAMCSDYCTAVMEACVDEVKQYATSTGCMDVCMALPFGEEGTKAGNSVACRMFWALEAVEDSTLCAVAGPGGDGVCGSNCEGFCRIEDQVCLGDNKSFDNVPNCLDACRFWSEDVPFSADVLGGNSLACRMGHLTLAASNPSTHCSHVVDASLVCVD